MKTQRSIFLKRFCRRLANACPTCLNRLQTRTFEFFAPLLSLYLLIPSARLQLLFSALLQMSQNSLSPCCLRHVLASNTSDTAFSTLTRYILVFFSVHVSVSPISFFGILLIRDNVKRGSTYEQVHTISRSQQIIINGDIR